MRDLDLGEQIYLGIASVILLAAFLIMPFRDPQTQERHWSAMWSSPRYDLKQMDEILPQETAAEIAKTAAVSEGFLANSTTANMSPQIGLHRSTVLLAVAVAVLGWFVVPPQLERVIDKLGTRSR
ncbi:MAG: hypothetical protein AAF394_07035 [Planctomycetota bacterium]